MHNYMQVNLNQIIAKSGLPLFCVNPCISNWLDANDLSGLLGLYSVSISVIYLGPIPLSDL